LDLAPYNQKSISSLEIIRNDYLQAKIIVMDYDPRENDTEQYIKAGTSGFILKDATQKELLNTIRKVNNGGSVLPPAPAKILTEQDFKHTSHVEKSKLLDVIKMTNREHEVVELLGEGKSNKEIGQIMKISAFTVKSHVHNIMEKLVLHTRLEIAKYSYQNHDSKDEEMSS